MDSILIRVIEKIFIIYFIGYFLFDIILFIIFLYSFRSDKKKYEIDVEMNEFYPRASIIVPAYNEEVSIVHCINMLINLDYPDFEIIIVNDGSADKTLDELLHSFDFKEIHFEPEKVLSTSVIKKLYKTDNEKILLIDKQNGGKADAINAGINFSAGKFICTIDADSILDRESLKKVVMPMLMDRRVFVSGGQLAVSNDTVIEDNHIVNFKMPRNIWVLWQITEYIKSFLVSRIGLSKLNSLLIMSGAFSLFRREDLINVGGFLSKYNEHVYLKEISEAGRTTVCEDMEIIVRLWRYYHENKKAGRVVYLPKPLCWTEVPDNAYNIFKQRTRWHLGLAESLYIHKSLMFEPAYYSTGMIAFPYYFFFELLSPLIKLSALIFIIFTSFAGLINTKWVFLMLLLITVTTALITSIVTVYLESWSEKQAIRNRDALRYKSVKDWFKLVTVSIAGDFSYSFFKIIAQCKGLIDFAGEKNEWNKFERKGLRKVVSSPAETN